MVTRIRVNCSSVNHALRSPRLSNGAQVRPLFVKHSLACMVTGSLVLLLASCGSGRPALQGTPSRHRSLRPPVAALGFLRPSGDSRVLAGPSIAMGIMPRVQKLYVREGSQVRRGQLLARFDNYPKAEADLGVIEARLNANRVEIEILEKETKRYRYLARMGAVSLAELETRELQLQKLRSVKAEAEAQQLKVKADALDASLLAPMDGRVLMIFAREGEHPGNEGVMQIGDSSSMEVVAQVDEGDISRVAVDQKVSVTSENGAFPQTLHGRVYRISPLVRQRQRLSSRPLQDADTQERVIEVYVLLSQADSLLVSQLTNSRVVAVFSRS